MANQPPENIENMIRNELGPLQSLVELTRISLSQDNNIDMSKHINIELVDICQRSIDQIIMIARISDDAIDNPEFDVNEHL